MDMAMKMALESGASGCKPMQSRVALMLVFASMIWTPASDAKPPACSAQSGPQVMPLVELYTSEGCSSCPPADRWLSRAHTQHKASFLAFHVDYWDRLGWPDRFASVAYSQRQRRRVNAAGERTVYTPQVMIGPQIQVDWRNDAGFARALTRQRQAARVNLALAVDQTAAGAHVTLDAMRDPSSNDLPTEVWLAQYSDAEVTHVERGENGGVTLRHDRVVRQLWGPWTIADAPISRIVELQHALSSGGLVAFAQDRRGQVQQSLSLAGAACVEAQQ